MKKILKSLIIIALCMISTGTNAQDLITKADGTDISAKVLEVTTSVIKYKKFENQDGPIYNIKKSDVLMIRYKNGTKDIFNEPVSVEDVSTENEDKYEKKNPPISFHYSEMIIGEEIIIKKITKGLRRGAIYYYQNDRQLHYKKMFKTLETIDVCEENMKKAGKRRNTKIPLIIIAIVTFPPGTLILMTPIIIIQKKESKSVELAIEDYNNSLK